MRVTSIAAITLAAFVGQAMAFLPPNNQLKASMSRHAMTMAADVGTKLPMSNSFQLLKDGKPTDVTATELFAGKKVVIVGVPGALTPTCSEKHVPGYIAAAEEFKSKGVDDIVVLSVNDCFVVNAWAKQFDTDKVKFLADGGAGFTKAAGLEFDTGDFGGVRMQRLSAYVEDGVVKKIHLEGGGGLSSSAADVLLGEL